MQLQRVENKEKINKVKNALMEYSRHFAFSAILDSNLNSNESNGFEEYDLIAAFSNEGEVCNYEVLSELDKLWMRKRWRFLSVSYDLKNELEELESKNNDNQEFPLLTWFEPEVLLLEKKGELTLFVKSEDLLLKEHVIDTKSYIDYTSFKSRFTKEQYLDKIDRLKKHIDRGDVYEANFCQEFYLDQVCVDPLVLWQESKKVATTPFSVYYRVKNHHLISGSPERFVKKVGTKIVSQPIKGTIRRGENSKEDQENRDSLKKSLKDQNENVMIVDLVRNDLSKIAKDGSVEVDELYGIYAFSKVFHMISTISAQVKQDISLREVFEALFPMGSMTGAPKVKAMEIMEELENFQRGIYSGTIGYIDPDNNFDFNVVIRSLVYNDKKEYLSYAVGGAITKMSNPEMEWEECRLKAKTMEIILANYAERSKKVL